MKKNIFVIATDNAFDMEQSSSVEQVGFATMKEAKARLKEKYNELISEYDKDEIEEGSIIVEVYDTSFQIYEDGRYVENHACASIEEVCVEFPEPKKK